MSGAHSDFAALQQETARAFSCFCSTVKLSKEGGRGMALGSRDRPETTVGGAQESRGPPGASQQTQQSTNQQTVTAWVAILLFAAILGLLAWILVSHWNYPHFMGGDEDLRPRWEWRAFGWLLENGTGLATLLAPLAFAVPIAVGLVGKVYQSKHQLLLFSLGCIAGALLALTIEIELSGSPEATEALLDNACVPAEGRDNTAVPAAGEACIFPVDNEGRVAKINQLRERFLFNIIYLYIGALLITLGLTPRSKQRLGQGVKWIKDAARNWIGSARSSG